MRRTPLLALFLAAATLHAQITVPFVGCPSDGQTGPLDPPKGLPKRVALPKAVADQFSYYKAEEGFGVLAPRGWYCFSTYGSNGGSLYIAPQRIDGAAFFETPHVTFNGPVIQLSTSVGDTSGRFEVAEIIGRLFPAHREFARRVHNEQSGVKKVPNSPASTDKLHYLSDRAVEYVTPPNDDGEGTHTWLVKNDQPITGVVILTGKEFSAIKLAIRLTLQDAALAPYITHQLERDTKTAQ